MSKSPKNTPKLPLDLIHKLGAYHFGFKPFKHIKMEGQKEFTAQACTKAVNNPEHAQMMVLIPPNGLTLHYKLLARY